MTRSTIVATVLVLVLLALVAGRRALEQDGDLVVTTTPGASEAEAHQGLLYGRVTDVDGVVYEGRLRWGGNEEALWGHYFNGVRDENRWAVHVPHERLPRERSAIEIFGFEIADWERRIDLGRPFMARLGDIARVEARGRDLLVTLKSGTVFELDRFSADDFADGIRVWDGMRGVVDLDERRMRAVELLPNPARGGGPAPLHGTVRTRQREFTGFIQWDREESLGTDALEGDTAEGALSLRFDMIRSIARRSRNSALVTLLDGRTIVLSGSRDAGVGNRGIYVDDRRFGRVLVSWDAFETVDFSPGGSGPAYGDFPPGEPLRGSVTTRTGHLLAGQLVFDLDESETTETLDAPSSGVDYTIPFSLIASIKPPGPGERPDPFVTVTLHDGEELQLERSGDLGDGNAGMLIFDASRQLPEYVFWTGVERVDYDHPLAIYPPSEQR
jgi:hypothetical protein